MENLQRRLRFLCPIVASSTVFLTLVICFILSHVNDVYIGGLTWPYFSDMGRDPPAYYIFVVGLCTVAVTLSMTWIFNYQHQAKMIRREIELGHLSQCTLRWALAVCVLGVVSTIGLPVLSICSTSECPSLHNLGAYFFFILETFAVFINTAVSRKIFVVSAKSSGQADFIGVNDQSCGQTNTQHRTLALRRTYRIQLVFSGLFLIAFLLYIPIGLAIIAPFKRLTIEECLERNLGNEYCTRTMRYNDKRTKLWNYEDDFAMTQLRAVAQLACILTLVGYSVSFMAHDYENPYEQNSITSTEDDQA